MLKRAIACLVLFTAVLGATPVFAQNPVRYIYDDLGRIVGVIDQNGDAATYTYDAVGNLLSIARTDATTVSVIAFSPGSGTVGATVTISGTGFSSTASSNAVTFNGTAATVSTATANQLVVTVPSGATTGTISVTSPGGSATSATAFTVGSASLAPTIASFSPTGGVAGTAVTVTGTNFDTTLPNDRTRFNATFAMVSTGTSTSLSTAVPSSTGSGHIGVATPYGTAVSTDDFLIPPSPYGIADVQVFGRIPFSTATTVTMSTANSVGVMLFDSSPGHRVSVRGTNGVGGQVAGCNIWATLYNPNATALVSPTCMDANVGVDFMDAVAAPASGTYSLLVAPAAGVTGGVTLTVYDVPADVTGTITPGGSPVTLTTTTPGQNGRLTFSGTAGHRVSLQSTNGIGGQVAGCNVFVGMLNPDASMLVSPTCMDPNVGSQFVDPVTLGTTGTYTITVDPALFAVGSQPFTLYDVPADPSGTVTIGGSSLTLTTTTPGQNASATFSGTSGQQATVHLTGSWVGWVTVRLLSTDGTVLTSTTTLWTPFDLSTQTLPATGTYTIVIDPAGANIGSITVNVTNP